MKKRMIKFGFLAILTSFGAGIAWADTYKAVFTNTTLQHNLLVESIEITDPSTTTVQCSGKDLNKNGTLACSIDSTDTPPLQYGSFIINFEYTVEDGTCKYGVVHEHFAYNFVDPHPQPPDYVFQINVGETPPSQDGIIVDVYSRCEG